MNLLIVPIDKNGVRKVGLKVIDADSEFIKIFKSYDFTVSTNNPFAYFWSFCGEMWANLKGLEFSEIELTDGYDVQDKNIYIDYAHTPPRITIEDKEGLPTQLESGRKIIEYIRKSDGQKFKYNIVKEKERDDKYLHCIVEKDGKQEPRKFLLENIISEVEE